MTTSESRIFIGFTYVRHRDEGDRSKEDTFYKEPFPELGPETLPANRLRQTSLTLFRVNHFTSILFQNNWLDGYVKLECCAICRMLNSNTRPNTEDGEKQSDIKTIREKVFDKKISYLSKLSPN